VVTGIIQLGDETKRNKPYVDAYGGAIRKSGNDALWAANAYGVAAQEADNFNNAITKPKDSESRDRRHELREENRRLGKIGSVTPAFTMPDFSSLLGAMTGGGAAPVVDAIDEINDAQEQAARKEQEILDKRKSAFESFNDSVKSLFGQIKDSILSSFNLPTLGNSVNSITRNISKLLERTKNFAKNISQLSGMGLNSALLQQVIQAGPMAGSQLASALVGGGSGFVEQINRAYTDFGNLAGGIAGVGTTGAFANQQTVNNYSIEVTGGLATGSDVGRAVVNAIRDYERQSGAAWRA
jgi:hypothetical protein